MFLCPCQNPTPSYSAPQDAKSPVLPSVLSAARGAAANQTNESAGPGAPARSSLTPGWQLGAHGRPQAAPSSPHPCTDTGEELGTVTASPAPSLPGLSPVGSAAVLIPEAHHARVCESFSQNPLLQCQLPISPCAPSPYFPHRREKPHAGPFTSLVPNAAGREARCYLMKPASLPGTHLHQLRMGFVFGCFPGTFFHLFIFSTGIKYLEHKMTNLPLCSRCVLRPFGNC